MKSLIEYMNEALSEEDMNDIKNEIDDLKGEVKDAKKDAADAKKDAKAAEDEASKSEESIKNEKDFGEFARAKFEKVFGDKLDEKKMKDTIDGLLADNKELVNKGEWGKLAGMLNKSFGS